MCFPTLRSLNSSKRKGADSKSRNTESRADHFSVNKHTSKNNIRAMSKSSKKTEPKEPLDERLAEYRESFNLFDKDGSGKISTSELKSVIQSLGQRVSSKDVKKMIQEVDDNNDGEIDFEEFVKMMNKASPASDEDRMRDAFNVFDKDGNGYITLEEMKQVMANLGEELTEEEVKDMINVADSDGDGQVNFQEFKNVMHQRQDAH